MDNREKLEEAKRLYETANADQKYVLERLFPELKEESEDERIRKALIELVQGIYMGCCTEEASKERDMFLAWLEKQGDHTDFLSKIQVGDKVTRNEDGVLVNLSQLKRVAKKDEKQGEQKTVLPKWKYKKDHTPLLRDSLILNKYGCVAKSLSGAIVSDVWVIDYDELAKLPKEEFERQNEQKPNDKVEPKFKVGDWIVYRRNDSSMEIILVYDIRDNRYYFNDNVHFSWSVKECDEKCHLWTIQDAKDGDVLACNEEILLFKSYSVQGRISLYCWYNGQTNNFHSKGVDDTLLTTKYKICPATKEQRDILMKAMADAGYTFNFEKKELKKVEQKPAENKGMNLVEEEMTPFQKKVFCIIDTTIEEEQGLKQVCDELFALASNEIKQNPAWSEDDELHVNSLLKRLEGLCRKEFAMTRFAINEDEDWLKSLRPQNRWKPSERDLGSLADAIIHYEGIGIKPNGLKELFEQLKKLREE